MRTQADRDDDLAIGRELERKDAEIDRLRALADAYKDYAILLEGAESRLLGLANAHGYRTPAEGVERGKTLRAEIERLNQQLHVTTHAFCATEKHHERHRRT